MYRCVLVLYVRRSSDKVMGFSETARFYKALSQVGTDFSLMCRLFPSRSRRELKVSVFVPCCFGFFFSLVPG